ncbi:MAG: hypothetical protein GXP55_03305 [Deltaproteobacteria bacterium]|nr:hypothetical protein [Deltaproteobacteria bacterium]
MIFTGVLCAAGFIAVVSKSTTRRARCRFQRSARSARTP